MSIYCTSFEFQLPLVSWPEKPSDWLTVTPQVVPGHIGTPKPGYGYEDGDPYASFLPPPVDDPNDHPRAVVFIDDYTDKGTERSGHEYANPLLVLTGAEWLTTPFRDLIARLTEIVQERYECGVGFDPVAMGC